MPTSSKIRALKFGSEVARLIKDLKNDSESGWVWDGPGAPAISLDGYSVELHAKKYGDYRRQYPKIWDKSEGDPTAWDQFGPFAVMVTVGTDAFYWVGSNGKAVSAKWHEKPGDYPHKTFEDASKAAAKFVGTEP